MIWHVSAVQDIHSALVKTLECVSSGEAMATLAAKPSRRRVTRMVGLLSLEGESVTVVVQHCLYPLR